MRKHENTSNSQSLRQKAEELLKKRPLKSASQLSEVEMCRLIYEMGVHEIELELQNDEFMLAKEQAEVAAKKYAQLYNYAPSAYYTLSKEHKILEVNFAGAQMLGKDPSNLKNKQFGIFVSEATKPVLNLFLENLFNSKIKESCEVTLLQNDKISIFVHLSGIITENAEQCILTATDITKIRLEQERLLGSEEKYRNIFDRVQDAYFEASIDGTLLEISPSIEIITKGQYSRNEMIGKSFTEFNTNPDDRNSYFSKLFDQGRVNDHELSLCNKDGSIVPVAVSAALSFDADGNPAKISGILRDITEKKLAENEILDLNKNLEQKIEERTLQLTKAKKNLEQEIILRKRMGESLRESKKKYRDIFDESISIVCLLDEKNNFIDVNQAGLDLLGYSLEEIRQMNISDVDADQVSLLPVKQEIMSLGRLINYEHKVRHKNGRIFTVLNNSKPMIDGNGNIVGILSTLIDITARKQAEQALQELEARFSLFMDHIPALVFIKDDQSTMVYANNAIDNALGASKWIGKSLFDFFDSEIAERIIDDDKKTLQSGYQKIEESFINLDGKTHHYETQKFAIPIAGQKKLLGGIAIDITDRKLAEEKIIKSRDEATKARLAMSEFLSRISHELHTPLHAILGFAQLLDMSELLPKQKKGVDHILTNGKHLLNLIDEVLDITGIESGKLPLLFEPVQLSGIVAEVIDMIQPMAFSRELKLELENSGANELFVMSDRKRLKQVLMNLLDNAVKYNRQGGSILVKIESIPPDHAGIVSVRISVTDIGLGIAPDDILKLFVPFERIGAEETQTEGIGLGLAVVKRIMDAVDGKVGVESIVGEGSTFWIELPITEEKISWENQHKNNVKLMAELDDANKELAFQNEEKANRAAELVVANKELAFQNEEKANRAAELVIIKKQHFFQSEETLKNGIAATAKTGTILYFDDNIPNIELVESIIENYRPEIQLITSTSGKYAVKLATETLPDLILLDLDLHDIKSSDVLANLRADDKTKSIPVLIFATSGTQDEMDKLMVAGVSEFLTKPLSIVRFLEVVDGWMG